MNKRIKKLTLSRESIRALTDEQARQAAGASIGLTNSEMPSHCPCSGDVMCWGNQSVGKPRCV